MLHYDTDFSSEVVELSSHYSEGERGRQFWWQLKTKLDQNSAFMHQEGKNYVCCWLQSRVVDRSAFLCCYIDLMTESVLHVITDLQGLGRRNIGRRIQLLCQEANRREVRGIEPGSPMHLFTGLVVGCVLSNGWVTFSARFYFP